MNQRVLRALLAVAGGAVWLGCSSSTEPKPTVAGTWHVTVGTMNRGAVTPAAFDVIVAQSGDTFTVSMPTLQWSTIAAPVDGPAGVVFSSDTTQFGFYKSSTSGDQCLTVAVVGTLNGTRSAMSSVRVIAGDSLDVQTQLCQPQSQGAGTATK